MILYNTISETIKVCNTAAVLVKGLIIRPFWTSLVDEGLFWDYEACLKNTKQEESLKNVLSGILKYNIHY